jgi:CRP/FNR family transcriptional regulator, cyclic AMP receptor protein
MAPETALLAEVPLFQLLDDNERAELASHLEVVQQPAGHVVFEYGDAGDTIFIVRDGEVELFLKDDTGERIVLERVGRGDFFGELSFLDNGSRSSSAVVTADAELLHMDRGDLEKFLRLRPAAAMDFLTAMGKRHRVTVERLRHTASRNVNEEIADTRSLVQKCADWIAEFSGSIPFLVVHAVLFVVWIWINLGWMPFVPPFDPYPFGLLTMAVSLEAIFLSVFVLLSQNRQAAKDRVRSDVEYEVNLKAELEIAHLHEKVDRLSEQLLSRMAKVEKVFPRDESRVS